MQVGWVKRRCGSCKLASLVLLLPLTRDLFATAKCLAAADLSSTVFTTGSCAHGRPVNLTSDRGLIELSLASSMSRSSSKNATLQFDCRWLIQPSTDRSSVVLQFLNLRLFGSAAAASAASSTKSSCSENFVEVRVGRNLVSCFVLPFRVLV